MCREYRVYGTTPAGDWADAHYNFDFPSAEEERVLPPCTCSIGKDTPEGNAIWDAFCMHLRLLIAETAYGRIVIEVF